MFLLLTIWLNRRPMGLLRSLKVTSNHSQPSGHLIEDVSIAASIFQMCNTHAFLIGAQTLKPVLISA